MADETAGLVTRPVAGYHYSANWATCHWQDFHLLDHQLASLQYPGALKLPNNS
jgi:hypothetical protein